VSGLNLKRALKKYKPKIIQSNFTQKIVRTEEMQKKVEQVVALLDQLHGRPSKRKIFDDPVEQFMDDNWNYLFAYSTVDKLEKRLDEVDGKFLLMVHRKRNGMMRLFVNVNKIRDSMLTFYDADDDVYESVIEKIQVRLGLMFLSSQFMDEQRYTNDFIKVFTSKAKCNFYFDLYLYDWKKSQIDRKIIESSDAYVNFSMDLYHSENIFARGHDNSEKINREIVDQVANWKEIVTKP